jgi:hypothetical protein
MTGQVLVVYRDGVWIKIPAKATNLHPAPPRLLVSKLSIDSVRDLVRLARKSGKIEPGTSACRHDCLKHESESDLANSHGCQRGEP